MSIELKPCPFCGGEAYLRDFGAGFHSVCCWNRACAMTCETPVRISAEKAITDWNTRAERTCFDEAGAGNYFECSECHIDFYISDQSVSYCPNCGAKVVKE